MIKDKINIDFPGIIFILRNEENKVSFVNFGKEMLRVIFYEKINALIKFMPRRLTAVR